MFQLKILSGKMAGTSVVARRFPFHVGRAAESDLPIEEPGVWDRHLEIQFEPANGFMALSHGEALFTINGAASDGRTRLRNGDRIELGGAVLQFWLGETRQRGLRFHEWLMWMVYVTVFGFQLYLIYRLL